MVDDEENAFIYNSMSSTGASNYWIGLYKIAGLVSLCCLFVLEKINKMTLTTEAHPGFGADDSPTPMFATLEQNNVPTHPLVRPRCKHISFCCVCLFVCMCVRVCACVWCEWCECDDTCLILDAPLILQIENKRSSAQGNCGWNVPLKRK